jgi:hypothetical protein
MSLMPTSPRPIGGVLDSAFRLYRHAFVPALPLALVVAVLTTVLGILAAANTPQPTADDPLAGLRIFTIPAVLGGYLLAMLIMLVIYGALFARIDAVARGEQMSVGEALGAGMNSSGRLLGVGILLTIMLVLGTLLLVIPGIYLWGVFQLAVIPPVLERAGVLESFGISRRLVKGNWWRVFLIVFVAFCILMVLSVVVGVIAGVVAGIAGPPEAGSLGPSVLLTQVLTGLMNLITLAFFPCVMLAVYYDLKLRKEGTDLAGRLGELNPGR